MPVFLLPTIGGAILSWAAGFWGEKSAQGEAGKNWYLIGGAVVALLIILFLIYKVL